MQIQDKELRAKLIEGLEQFVTEERKERLQTVLANRTRHVTVVLEDLYQTQNISAVMRSCECYGVQDAYIVENRNTFEVHKDISMGADKWLTLRHYPHSEHNVKQCIDDLHARGYTVIATLPDEKRTTIMDLPVERKTAFLFGTELTGLSEEAVRYADGAALIPMYGFTESFNISNSAAIILSLFTMSTGGSPPTSAKSSISYGCRRASATPKRWSATSSRKPPTQETLNNRWHSLFLYFCTR